MKPYGAASSSSLFFAIIMSTAVCPTDICPQADAAAPSKETEQTHVELVTVIQGDDAPDSEVHPSLLDGEPDGKSMLPNLEAFISGEYLPDSIDVYFNSISYEIQMPCLNSETWQRFIERHPVRFVREYPSLTQADKGNDVSKPSESVVQDPTTGRLDLRCSKPLGEGSHSYVILAPLTLPSTPPALSIRGTVAVKMAKCEASQRRMLWNEAKIYNAFPRKLQEGSSNAPPIVPKFYGYYVPSLEAFDSTACDKFPEEERVHIGAIRKIIKHITPILLLESCGKQVCAQDLSSKNGEEIGTLLRHLHAADFAQGSFYERNIIVQPGPLALPRAERSFKNPSYRIIDFGRGMCPRVNCKPKDFLAEVENDRKHAWWL